MKPQGIRNYQNSGTFQGLNTLNNDIDVLTNLIGENNQNQFGFHADKKININYL